MTNIKKIIIFLCLFINIISFSVERNKDNIKNEVKTQIINADEYTKQVKELENNWRDNHPTIVFEASKKVNFDTVADDYSNTIRSSIDKSNLGTTIITIMILVATIQMTLEIAFAYANGRVLIDIVKILIKNFLTFTIYVLTVRLIFNGKLIKESLNIAYAIVKAFTGNDTLEPLTGIWTYSQEIIAYIWDMVGKVWYFNLWHPLITIKSFGTGLAATIFLLILILMVLIAFFAIMFDIFKLLLTFIVAISLSTILLPLGLADQTKPIYSISKILSLLVNFIIKISSINIFLILGMVALKRSRTLEVFETMNENGITITDILNSNFIVFCILIWVVLDLIRKINIEF
ncbi:hypothetical protein [Oceanivirga miroungae]|uniref:TrbL/VirB6 plasmid conjugal transfer protein n=1 Tax=Oceanivirga miroungae TaxID=1130046 RepID=A0A6I8M680_9FUSO|nr:hypothetical protein [Oceanivirga miroungae]VWL84933.1 hypothetical protein OMES3154_00206 [Oceanivirga miroungae]